MTYPLKNTTEFVLRLTKDDPFKDRFLCEVTTADAVVEWALFQGYAITHEELLQALSDHFNLRLSQPLDDEAGRELTESELDGIDGAGGFLRAYNIMRERLTGEA